MKDTSAEMEQIFRERLMALTGAERVRMGCSMFDTAKELIRASFRNENLPLSGPEYRQRLFLRIYGDDFDEEAKTKILKHFKKLKTDEHLDNGLERETLWP